MNDVVKIAERMVKINSLVKKTANPKIKAALRDEYERLGSALEVIVKEKEQRK